MAADCLDLSCRIAAGTLQSRSTYFSTVPEYHRTTTMLVHLSSHAFGHAGGGSEELRPAGISAALGARPDTPESEPTVLATGVWARFFCPRRAPTAHHSVDPERLLAMKANDDVAFSFSMLS